MSPSDDSQSVEHAVGKLITGKVTGTELDAETARLIESGTMSGVTLFKDNARDLPQLIALVDHLRRLGGEDFLIAVDQEGGAVQRFDHVLTPLPSAMALGAIPNSAATRSVSRISAEQLRLLGVNCALAPVLDINSNPRNPIIGTRAFGAEREQVTELGTVVAEAYLSEGILPVGKHYPGHGDTFEDSHMKLAVVRADRSTLQERELYPFIRCAGSLPSMLVGHVWLTEFDKEALPASLSKNVTEQLLRRDVGYDGFLMSDDMPVMKAIVDHWGLEEAAVMAINAGLDNLLISGSIEQIKAVHRALCDAVRGGQISEARIESALRRRATALAHCRNDRPDSLPERERSLNRQIQIGNDLVAEISARAVRVTRGELSNPLTEPDDWVLVLPNHPRYRLDVLTFMSARMRPGAPAIRERRYSLDPMPDEIQDVVTFAAGKKCLFMTFRALLHERQLELGRALAEKCSGGLLVAADVPYELDELKEWRNAVATYDPSDLAMAALVSVITGKSSTIPA